MSHFYALFFYIKFFMVIDAVTNIGDYLCVKKFRI